MTEITPSCDEDTFSLGRQSAHAAALGLYRMLGQGGNTVELIRDLIAVPPKIARVLLAFARAHPEEAHSVQKNLKFRQAVGIEFERLVREGVPLAELAEGEEAELDASDEASGLDPLCSTMHPRSCSYPEASIMRRTFAVIVFLCSLVFAASSYPQHHSSGSHSSKSHASKKKGAKNDKRVHVRGYTRKDGTYVAPYDRSAPGTAGSSSDTADIATRSGPYRKDFIAEGYSPHASVQRDKHGKIKRSGAAKSAFERQSPCPSTGRTSGRCPGYVVDHVTALECGGADAPSNMQWQTTADAKAKDKTERNCRL
jgi:hypothetical protein